MWWLVWQSYFCSVMRILCAVVLLLCALLGTSSAQLFTCADNVTLCTIATESCCCTVPLVAACVCCLQASQVCDVSSGTCVAPSPSGSITPTPTPAVTQTPQPTAVPTQAATQSPSATPPCSSSGTTLTCLGDLAGVVIVVPPTVSVVVGDLTLADTTQLTLSVPLDVQGDLVVGGVINYTGVVPTTGGYVVLFTSNNTITVGNTTTVIVEQLPVGERSCERVQSDTRLDSGGHSFGVLVTVDSTQCGRSGGGMSTGVIIAIAFGGKSVV